MKSLLNSHYSQYAQSSFIANDPIAIPHGFSSLQDIEIAGFFAAIFSWGRRDIILQKSTELMRRMDNQPFSFIQTYRTKDFKKIQDFKHRTFNASDLDFYIRAFQVHYRSSNSLESAFGGSQTSQTVEPHLIYFYNYLSQLVPSESRNLKHISTPAHKSACKRLCMYLRWMVRKDEVDLGLWKSIDPSQLIIPLDVHVMKIAQQLQLLSENDKPQWNTALKLTKLLKKYDAEDPVKYDFALFSMGINLKK